MPRVVRPALGVEGSNHRTRIAVIRVPKQRNEAFKWH